MRNSLTVAALGLVVLLPGCASVQLGDPAVSAQIKKFEARPDVGRVYVCRDNPFGLAVKPSIEIDGKPQGNVGVNNFAYAELAPGKYKIVAKTPEHDSTVDFSIAAGEQKFFKTWVSLGVFVGWGLIEEESADQGKACLEKSALVVAAKS